MNTKKCNKCLETLDMSLFYKNSRAKDLKQSICKKCKRECDKKYYYKNEEYFKNYRDKYYENNREYLIKTNTENNVKKRMNCEIENFKEKTRGTLRTRLNYVMSNKDFGYCKLIGCDYHTFKKHMMSFFSDKIRHDNRSEWQIDHIKPLYKAKTLKEVRKLSNYKNIQILLTKDNKDKYFKNKFKKMK